MTLLSESVDRHGVEELISPRAGGAQVDERVTCHKVPQRKRFVDLRIAFTLRCRNVVEHQLPSLRIAAAVILFLGFVCKSSFDVSADVKIVILHNDKSALLKFHIACLRYVELVQTVSAL